MQKLLWAAVNLAMLGTLAAAGWALTHPAAPLPEMFEIGEWSLTERSGRPFGRADLRGQVWIANFIFTNCAGPCPLMTDGMKQVQERLSGEGGLRFVTFSVDPDRDTPEVLRRFAERWEADPQRWFFVTGREVYNLVYDRFHLEARPVPDPTPGSEILHDTRFVLVDRRGRLRGLYEYSTSEALIRLARDARRLAREPEGWMSLRTLPRVNAALNGGGAALLCLGFYFILRRRVTLHKACMVSALLVSVVFLASYLYYHFNAGLVRYHGEGWMRPVYFGVLGSHTVLAGMVAPMALATVWLGWRDRLARHVRLARWTLPLWLYVNITGILVYLLLYVVT
ncbi:MAG: DUF420 domain-containing protein [Planctomycetes bacterium]|nr:DUF420 domain-containing protein [Planctomycetota bacterium]